MRNYIIHLNHKLKNMNKVYFIAVIFVSTLFLLSPRAVLSQQEERLAVVSEYEGDVKAGRFLANIENVNNNEFATATMVAIRDGIKQAFSDTIDHMSSGGHECITGNHLECDQI